MLVLRTVCHTDWKGRPHHTVEMVAKTEHRQRPLTRKDAIAAMDADIHKWLSVDVAIQELGVLEEAGNPPNEEGWEDKRAAELAAAHTLDELLDMWKIENQKWEMSLTDCDHREFAEVCDGDNTTTVYHLLKDDFDYTDKK